MIHKNFEDSYEGIYKEKQRKINRLHWKDHQNRIYLTYLKQHASIFDAQLLRRNRPFLAIAKLLKTKKPTQVKSHHQKMKNYYGSVQGIIQYLQEKLSNSIPSLKDVISTKKNSIKSFETSSSTEKLSQEQYCNRELSYQSLLQQQLGLEENRVQFNDPYFPDELLFSVISFDSVECSLDDSELQ